tara:strand:+ start:307 stop:588 length:282 start_codon:yes stop_codon:yes gene_type:complete
MKTVEYAKSIIALLARNWMRRFRKQGGARIMGEGKHIVNLGKESILIGVECEYCSNPAKHQTRTLLSGVLGRLEDTCNFHHVAKQDNQTGGGK